MKVMGTEMALWTVDEMDIDIGVRYELYKGTDADVGAIRVFDLDADRMVEVRKYPTFAAAETAVAGIFKEVN
jgi:hypothetical protein